MQATKPSFRYALAATLGIIVLMLFYALGAAAQDQPTPDPSSAALSVPSDSSAGGGAVPEAPSPAREEAALPSAPPQGGGGSSRSDDRWQVIWHPAYLWLPGFKGTVSAGPLTTPVDATFADIFHNLNIGYMTALDVRKRRVGLVTDLMYVSLSDSLVLSFPSPFSGVKADAKTFMLDPELYVRLKESDRGSVDVMGGFRYWHLDNKITFQPGILPGVSAKGGDNWVDGVAGMRFRLNLDKDKKWYIPVKGDAGGGGSNLTYQIFGGIGHEFKGRYAMILGYRHLSVDRRDSGKVFDVRQSGPLMSFAVKFPKPGPEVPPSASCSAEPMEVMAGEPVRVTATPADFPKGRTLVYSWSSSGGSVQGAENVGTVSTAGLAPGSYSVTVQVSDGNKASARCSAGFTVKEPPRNPPQISCSADPATVQSGTPSTISCSCSSPDGRPVTISHSVGAGSLSSSSGDTVTLDTAGLPAGPVTDAARCTDDRGLEASASATVQVEVPPPPPQASTLGECEFKTARVDNKCKAILDDVALRLQRDADARAVVVGQADAKERGKMAAQRAANIKTYLVKEKGIDASRIESRSGNEGGKRAAVVLVPAGASY